MTAQGIAKVLVGVGVGDEGSVGRELTTRELDCVAMDRDEVSFPGHPKGFVRVNAVAGAGSNGEVVDGKREGDASDRGRPAAGREFVMT